MKRVVDGYVFHNGVELYHMAPIPLSGPVYRQVMPGDIVRCYYDAERCEGIKQECKLRVTGGEFFQDNITDNAPDVGFIDTMEYSPLHEFIEDGSVVKMFLEFEAEWEVN